MPVILTIQPDSAQSAGFRDVLRELGGAEIVRVDSTEDALGVIDSQIPDLILLDTFLSPEDEERLTAYLRLLPAAKHVYAINIPFIGHPADVSPPPRDQHGFQRITDSWFRSQNQASSQSSTGWNPQAFAADVVTYLSRTTALRASDRESLAREQLMGADRREEPRRSPLDVALMASVRLAAAPADLVNVSPRGALVRTHLRPVSRAAADLDPASRSNLTLYSASGVEIRRCAKPIRCQVRSLGGGRMLYEVAFRFDESLALAPLSDSSTSTDDTVAQATHESSRRPPSAWALVRS